MKTKKAGFTLIELMVVLTIGSILLSISVNAFGSFQRSLAQRQSQRSFQAMSARARAIAVESGQNVIFGLDAGGDSIWISRNDTVLEMLDLGEEFGVNLIASSTIMKTCFNSRGIGDSGCTSFSSLSVAGFTLGNTTRYIFMLPLGGLVEQSGA